MFFCESQNLGKRNKMHSHHFSNFQNLKNFVLEIEYCRRLRRPRRVFSGMCASALLLQGNSGNVDLNWNCQEFPPVSHPTFDNIRWHLTTFVELTQLQHWPLYLSFNMLKRMQCYIDIFCSFSAGVLFYLSCVKYMNRMVCISCWSQPHKRKLTIFIFLF